MRGYLVWHTLSIIFGLKRPPLDITCKDTVEQDACNAEGFHCTLAQTNLPGDLRGNVGLFASCRSSILVWPGLSCRTRESDQVNKACCTVCWDKQPRADCTSLYPYTCSFLLSLVFLGQLRGTRLLPPWNNSQRLIHLLSASLTDPARSPQEAEHLQRCCNRTRMACCQYKMMAR